MKRIFITLFYILCFLFISCSGNNNIWEYDELYTTQLLYNSGDYDNEVPPIYSVDVLQIYKIDKKIHNHVLSLSSLRRQKLITELRNKDNIVNFFKLFQRINTDNMNYYENFRESESTKVFHIIAFDKTLMRAAYFRYYLYTVNGIPLGMIRTLIDSMIVNIEPPLSYLKETF